MLARLAAAALAVPLGAVPAKPQPTTPTPPTPAEPATPVVPLSRVVPIGEARTIAFYTSLFPDCSSQGPVVVRVLAPPRHGKVGFEDADSFARYAPSSPMAVRNTRKVPGKRMIYAADEGFEGADAFRILVITADGFAYESEVKIAVR